jgi:dihydrodipicolinate synthase/N-acetylneuraminate lyase
MVGLHGVLPIVPTVFTASGAVDEAETLAVVDYILGAGAQGLVFPGLASEYDTLTRNERLRMTALIGERVHSKVAFVVGASAESIDDVVTFAAAGAEVGAVAAMILTPKNCGTQHEAMVEFFRAAHAGSRIPIMLQNAPPPMGLGLPLEQVAKLARDVPAIRFVKEEAPPSGQRLTRLSELAGDALDAVFGGAGARYVIDELKRGARGTMPACELTELHVEMLARHARGDEAGARDLFERTLPLLNMQAVFRWRWTKALLRRRRLITSEHVRAPGPELDRYDRAELDALLERLSDLLPLTPRVA